MINPVNAVTLPATARIRIGIDLGGTKTEIIALDAGGGELLRRRRETPAENYQAALELIAGMVGEAEAELGAVASIGIGAPGALSLATGVIKNSNSTCLNGRPLKWGHNPLPLPQAADFPLPRCYCGRAGCVESYLSGPSLMRDHAIRTGEHLAPREIAARAAAGDANCEQTLARYEERLARALGTVINLIDPDVIVLGGGLSNLDRLYFNVPRLWGPGVFSDVVATRLVPNRHGDSSGVRGAAWLWGGR